MDTEDSQALRQISVGCVSVTLAHKRQGQEDIKFEGILDHKTKAKNK